MDTLEFFDQLHEKSWRSTIEEETSLKFDKLLAMLQEKRLEIIEEVVQDVKEIDALKLEDNEELTYSAFHRWMNKYLNENIYEKLQEENE